MKKTYIAIAALLLGQATPAFSQAVPFFDDFSDGVLSEDRYTIRTNNENSSVIVDNGMVRLQATGDGTASARAALDLVEQTDFIQADIKLDSTSMTEGAGMSRIMVSGVLYNDTTPFGVEDGGSLGDVLVQLSLRLKADGTLSSLICAFRSDDEDFGNITTIALDGFTECGQFTTNIQFGVLYTASIYIDQENRKLVFKLDGERVEHVITGNIFEPSPRAVSSVLALSNGVGTAVGFVDSISNSFDVAAEEETTDETTGDTTDETTGETTDETTEETTGETTEDTAGDEPANDDLSELESSSGCSIAGPSTTNDPMFLILAALALLVPGLRRTPLRRLLKTSKKTTEEETAAVV